MFSTEVCKKIVYALEQASGARWPSWPEKLDDEIAFPLDAALEYLRTALKAAANA